MAGKRTSPAGTAAVSIPAWVRPAVAAPSPPTDLDPILHDRTRLAIITALAVNQSLSFSELKTLTGASDGNLSVHARRLEERTYAACTKSFQGRMPRTHFAITPAGRRALQKYLDHMEAIIRHARQKVT